MKKIYILLLGIVIFTSTAVGQVPGGTVDFDIRIYNDPDYWSGYVVVQVRANKPETVPIEDDRFDTLQFGIKWDKSTINGNKLDFNFICLNDGTYNPFNLTQDESPIPYNYGGNGGWDCRNFELISSPLKIRNGWVEDEWVDIAILKVYRRTPGGQLEPVSNFYILQENDPHFVIPQPHKGFEPILSITRGGNTNSYMMNVPVGEDEDDTYTELSIPTETDGTFTWVGGRGNINDPDNLYDDYSWNHAANWDNGCGDGGVADHSPGELDDCLIPINCECYPRYPSPNYGEEIAKCNNLNIITNVLTGETLTYNAEIQWMDEVDGYNGDEVILNVYGDMNIKGQYPSRVSVYKKGLLEVGNQYIVDTMTEGGGFVYKSDLKVENSFLDIHSQGRVRVIFDTDLIGSMHVLKIFSGTEGPGNFKNMRDISYINGGDASIETFMENSSALGDYYFRTVGPTVYNQDYHEWGGSTGSGVALRNFDLILLGTYAYQFVESSGSWLNVYPYPYPIATATGLLLSDTSEWDHSFTQTGELITGDVELEINHTNAHIELISNPYPCAINWESLYARNISLVGPTIYIYDPTLTGNGWNNYNAITYQGTNGATGIIQVGQGFFVTTNGNGQFNFTDDDKILSDIPLRSDNGSQNSLRITIKGNGNNDDMVINFMNEANSGYDELYDTEDWGSYYADATQINSPVEGEQLSVTSLPFLYDQITHVPVNVICAKADTYSITFSNFESFHNVDIWLEDTYAQSDWIKITPENATYLFFQSPELQSNRFIVHFNASYLPNSIDEVQQKLIKIYSSGSDVYVINTSREVVKEISIFNLMGQEIVRTQVPQQNNYTFHLNETTAYYAVRVRTNKSVYSEKVLIMSH